MVPLKIVIPKNFLEEEERCGFHVTRQMKEIWSIELDLLTEFDRVCQKYGLKYTAIYGTLIGAVRHKGFIPWDDDLDVAMPRSDYEKLLQVAPNEFQKPYYLEWFGTDPCFVYDKAKLLNLNTTGLENYILEKHALFIDIFPYDNIIEDPQLQKEQGLKCKNLFAQLQRIVTCRNKWYCKEKGISPLRRIARYYEHYKNRLLGHIVGGEKHRSIFYQYTAENQKYNNVNTETIGDISFYHINVKSRLRISDFDDMTKMDFEFLKIPVISHYDENLTRIYGNWHEPINKRYAHTFKVIDTSRPYIEVLKEREIKYE